MRDILVTLITFGSLPVIVARPYVGILVWAWLGYMNPHRLGWGFAYDFPFALIVAVVTLVAMALSREPKRFPVTGLTVLWAVFLVWMTVTTALAFYPELAWLTWKDVMKIQLMTFATIVVMTSLHRLRLLVWIIVLSLGYFGVKGGVFTIINGGEYRVWGPPNSMVEGNNELALALLMILPLMQYLRSTSTDARVRAGLLVAMGLCAFSVVGSQSRGALVGGIAMALFFGFKSRHKLATVVALVVLIPALWVFMPDRWHDRMRTIETYDQDQSATARLDTWDMTVRLANDKLAGGGFELWSAETFERYSPVRKNPNDAHSIYFKVLAEHGWFGLLLFLGIMGLAWRTGSWVVRTAATIPELSQLADLVRMTQVSLIAFAAGGAFLSLSYFDLYWHLVAMMVVAKSLVQQHQRAAADAAVTLPPIATPLTPAVPGVRRGRGSAA